MLRTIEQPTDEPPCLLELNQNDEYSDEVAQRILNQSLSQEEISAKEDACGIEPEVLLLFRAGVRALTGAEQQLLRAAV